MTLPLPLPQGSRPFHPHRSPSPTTGKAHWILGIILASPSECTLRYIIRVLSVIKVIFQHSISSLLIYFLISSESEQRREALFTALPQKPTKLECSLQPRSINRYLVIR